MVCPLKAQIILRSPPCVPEASVASGGAVDVGCGGAVDVGGR